MYKYILKLSQFNFIAKTEQVTKIDINFIPAQFKNKMEQKTQVEQMLIEISNRANTQFKGIIQGDPKLQRQDTLKGVLYIVDQYRQILSKASSLSPQQKAKNYHVIYNTISYITQILSYVQKSSFSFQSIKPVVDCILSIQSNLVLADIKYLDKRTQLYLFLCKIYEQSEYYQPVIMLLDGAIKKYEQLRKIYELDQPVQKYITDILDNNLFILKVMNIKFSIQSNAINPNDWKKKTQEQLKDANTQKKLICLIQCLRTETRKNSNIFGKNQKGFKEALVQQGYDLIKHYLDILARGLKEMKQKIQFQISFKQKTMSQTLKQDQINQQIKKKRQLVGKHIKESQLKKASKSFPLQYHAELIYYAYQVKNQKVLEQLLRCAMIRVQCRRIQVPYVTDVKIQVSNTPYLNAKQGYDKIPVDLNQANLKEQLKKLRKSGKTDPNAKAEVQPAQQQSVGKDAKKAGKDIPPPPKQQPSRSDQPTEWQLQQINHKYVYMFIKRSFNPQRAIYDIKVVLGHEQKGPVGYQDSRRIIVPFIQKNQKVITSQIQQYKGMRESTQMVPYIILSHSQNSLQDQQQKKNLLVDVQPIIGKNPMVAAKLGHTKINMDLRQVPQEFIKMPGQSYIYLTHKNDYQFHLSSRLVQLFNSLVELENSYNTLSKQTNLSGEEIDKFAQLSITYSLQKLDQFFITFQDNLKGILGQEFYLDRNDFLTNLVFQLWKKYLQSPLQQIQYVMEQRLNQQIIDHDYQLYKQIINKCKPIFIRGLKVLNLVMVNNKKCDILLLSKISIQLNKLLEENKEYYLASQNVRLVLDRVRMARDEYFSKSVEAISDKLLPFSITCENLLIDQTIKKMKEKFLEQRLLIQKINKVKQISNSDKGTLSDQQLQQAELQWKLNRARDQYDETVQKISSKHSQFASLLASIDLDLLNIYFRVSLKHGEQLKKRGVNHTGYFSSGQLAGLADTLIKKLGFLQTKGNINQQKNLKQLQSTLIKAEKLPPPKPQSTRPQKRLIEQSHKNPYKLAILLLNLGALNSSNEDKKYYLKESLKSVKQCRLLQGKLLDNCVENSIFILSSIFDSEINPQKTSYRNKPFEDLYNGTWPCEGEKPQPPILVGKNSQCIYLKLPPFLYKDKKQAKQILNMKLYGKVSANGVDVSTNCDQLVGTATKQPVGKVVTVSHLQPNNNYCFAAAPLNNATNQMMDIGRTSLDIPTFNPLPVSSIAGNLAKVAYQIGEYDIAEEAARLVVSQFTELSEVLDPKTATIDQAIKLRLNQSKVQHTSLLQVGSIAESIYIMSLCQKRKLEQMRKQPKSNTIACQYKQRQVLNLLNLCASLQPALPCPITSITLATSQLSCNISRNSPLSEGFMLSLLQKEYMSPKVRKYGILIIRRLMAWGLQNNEISLVRRILYKWATRKWIVVGKVIQIAAQQKKDTKKLSKDPKEPSQQQKVIDKFCHYLIQKSPLAMDQFQDSLVSVSDDYSDLLSLYTQAVKQGIKQLSQSTDNGPEKAEDVLSSLNGKLQLAQLMRDPVSSIGKVNGTSKCYVQSNCKLIRRALQVSTKNQLKILAQKIEDFQKGQSTDQVKLSLDIFSLIQQAIENNIQFSPQSKNWVNFIMQKTQKKQLSKTIQIYEKYEQKIVSLTKSLRDTSFSLIQKTKDYDYSHTWLAQLNHLKAISLIMSLQSSNSQILKVPYKIKSIYTALESLSLQNLKKKQKQVEIMGADKVEYDAASLAIIEKVFKYIAIAMYSAFCIQNWLKFVNLTTLMTNFINFYETTPFYHNNSKCWVYLSLVAYMLTQMLKTVRKQGPSTYKTRYSKKQQNTELQSIYKILKPTSSMAQLFQPLYEQYTPSYFIPQLSNSTSKQPWFTQKGYEFLGMNSLVQVLVYTVQTLNLKQKNQIIIQLLRQFSNVTQHSFSLQLLPLLLDSQLFLLNEVQSNIDREESKSKQLDEQFQNQKRKHKKKRTAQITGQKMQFQMDYQISRKKIQQALELIKEERNFVTAQMEASRNIVQQIQRDCNKAALSQKQQKRYVQQFGEDQQDIWKNYQQRSYSGSLHRQTEERSSINKMNILSKNRKNLLKDLISKYEHLYLKLKNNKTSKDTLSEIMNRNQVGNLCYALTDIQSQGDNINKAFEFWNDALATIFRKVNPIDNYSEVIGENGLNLAQNIGFKELLIAIPIIYKVSQFCCHKNLNLQRKTIQFCTQIVYKLFMTSLVHPQHLHAFTTYRLQGFDKGYELMFYQDQVSAGQLSVALQYFILKGLDVLDNSQVVRVLPLVSLYEHIVVDIIKKTQKSLKAKMLKSLILSRCGQVKASSLSLYFMSQQKDLPILWLQKSDSLKKQRGQNWYPQTPLIKQNNPFYSPQNRQPIQQIKNLNFPQSLLAQVSLQLPVLFVIAKYSLIYAIYQAQLVQNFDANDERIGILRQVEVHLRESLRRLSVVEESERLKREYEQIKLNFERGSNLEDEQKLFEKKKAEINAYMKTNGQYDDGQVTRFLSIKSQAFKRTQLIQSMSRTRFLVYKVNLSRNLSTNCFYIIKNGLTNFNRYSYNARRAQSGYDPQIGVSAETPTQPAAKKEDKKGVKKQTDAVKFTAIQQINPAQQQRLRKQSMSSSKRSCPSALWHLKLTFQLGYLLYRQNNFVIALKVLEQLCKNSEIYNQLYYKLYAQSYIERCKLRLGEMNKQRVLELLGEVQANNFLDQEYVKLVMDFGQIFHKELALKLYEKGLIRVQKAWQRYGMKKYLTGLYEQPIRRRYAVSDELTTEQEDMLKKKSKKVQEKKAGGKQQKKAGKKDDGKKKKQQLKAQYKANILKKHDQVNLFQDEEINSSSHFREYTLERHPNFSPVNVYNECARSYLKCFTRYWQSFLRTGQTCIDLLIQANQDTKGSQMSSYASYLSIPKLLKIAQCYPQSNIERLMLLKIKSSFQKQQFLYQLQQKYMKGSLSKLQIKKLRLPYQDLPLNSRLNQIPSFFGFLTANLSYLKSSAQSFKQLIVLIPQISFILENDELLDMIVYEYAGTVMLLLEYSGSLLPKYMKLNDQNSVIQQKKTARKLLTSTFIKLLKYAIDLSVAQKRLNEEYYSFSKKQLQPNPKIDEDISMDIKNIDRECKSLYPLFLKQSVKVKQAITSLDLLTYLLKIRRQAQVMTFSNPLQNTLRKCHRILSTSLSTYKQNCIIPMPDLQKPLDSISGNMTLVKSKRIILKETNTQIESYIYILGNAEGSQSVIYGKFNIQMDLLSRLLQNCYKVQSKLKQSSALSQAVKERNYKQLQSPFAQLLRQMISFFGGVGPTSDPNLISNQILAKNLIKLSQNSISTLINLFNGELNQQSEQFNKFLKDLHIIKYRLREQKVSNTTSNSFLPNQANEKALQIAR